MAACSILLPGDLITHPFHLCVIKIRVVIIPVQHRVCPVKLFCNAELNVRGILNIGKQSRHTVIKHIGIDIIPPVPPITATQHASIRVGVVHHNIPAVVNVKIVLCHLNKVVAVLTGFVNP